MPKRYVLPSQIHYYCEHFANNEAQFIDTVGHYARPDMLSLLVNSKKAIVVTEMLATSK